MKRFKRVLLLLNLTDLDPTVLRYANLVARLTKPARLELVTVIDVTQLPENMISESTSLLNTAQESIKREITDLVTTHLQLPASCLVQVTVLRGHPAEELVRHAKDAASDLIIVGRDPKKCRAGTVPERLARMAPCSVLVVPRGSSPGIRSILAAVDFSRHSRAAVALAVAFGRAAGLEEVSCLHVYDVPANYERFGKSYEDFDAIMKRNALTAAQRFSVQVDTKGLENVSIVRQAALPSIAIQDEVASLGFDLIVMGARGSGAAQNVLLGSVSQRSINATQVPLLIVKSQSKPVGLMNALLKLFRRGE